MLRLTGRKFFITMTVKQIVDFIIQYEEYFVFGGFCAPACLLNLLPTHGSILLIIIMYKAFETG